MLVRSKLLTLMMVAALASSAALVQGQVYSDGNFGAGDYDTFLQNNTDVRFSFDYSSYDVFGDGFNTGSIPEAPNPVAGGTATTGVFLSVNNDSTVTALNDNFAAIFPKLSLINGGAGVGTGTATPNYRVTLDVFGSTGAGVLDSVDGILGNGDDALSLSGTTNKVHVGINHANPADVALEAVSMSLDSAGGGAGSAPSGTQGMGLGFTPDTGASEDYYGVYGGYQYTYRGGRPRSILDATATTTGRSTDFINEFWDGTPDFELVDTDADLTNDLNIFSGNTTFHSPDPNDLAGFDGSNASLGTSVRLYADNLNTTAGAPHYTVSDSDLQLAGFGANSRLLNNEENAPLEFPENSDMDPDNDIITGLDVGSPHNRWSEHEILFSDEIMTYSIDGIIVAQMAVADAADAVSSAGTLMLAYYDRFSSVASSPEGSNFVVYDNLVVEAISTGATPDLQAHLAGLGLLPSSSNPGDADGDGDVDGADFLLLQRTNPAGIADWEANYPGPLSAVGAVPEPSTAVLLIGLSLGMLSRRRR